MTSARLPCPRQSELRLFAAGELPSPEFEKIALHVENCVRCESALDDSVPADTEHLVAELRTHGIRLHELDELSTTNYTALVPSALLELARNAAVDDQAQQVSLDPGMRLANKLAEGPCRLGRFELQSELGVGSFGYVFKAHDTELDRTVALKVQRAGLFATNEDIERFVREAKSVARLKHPGIVSLFDTVRSEDDVCYLVTEYVEGDSLEKRMKSESFVIRDSVRVVAEIGDALQYAHEHGTIHRDVKPSNVLLDLKNHPHVMDFGLAKRESDPDNTMTSEGRVMGTPAYMSPEQARGDSHRVDARSDVYCLGVILFELLTGERPFQGNRRMLLIQVLEDEPRSPRILNSTVPRELETICLKSLSKSPGRRYSSAGEMAEDLRRFLRGEPIKARRIGYVERLWRWCRTYPLAASLLFAVPLVSIGGFAYLSWLSTVFVHSTALESTRMEADMLEDINEFYSENVVGPLDWERIKVTHQYATTPDSVPLPFTFMIDAAKRITADKTGMQVKIYSNYPWRDDGGPQDNFERRALESLAGRRFEIGKPLLPDSDNGTSIDNVVDYGDPFDERSYYEFTDLDGEPVLRYARAQIMQQSCVKCHNEEEISPKRDWREGDVAGVLAITRPLRRDVQSTRAGLRSAFYLIAGLTIVLFGVSLSILWAAKRQSPGTSKAEA